MSFKKKLRKINRGLILGGILLVGLIVHIVVDTVSFNNEKSVIRGVIEEYASAMCTTIVTDNPEVDSEGKLTRRLKEDKARKLEELISKYWTTDISGAEEYYYTKKNMDEWINNNYGEDNGSSCIVDSMAANIKDIKVSKMGPNGAKVEVDIELITTMVGLTDLVFPFSYGNRHEVAGNISDDSWETPVEQLDAEYNGKNIKSERTFYNQTIILLKEQGEWKISSSVDYGSGCIAYLVEEEDM